MNPKLRIDDLEPRIAPSGFGPSDNGNPGNEVSNGASPQPLGGGGGGGTGNAVSNGATPQPSGG